MIRPESVRSLLQQLDDGALPDRDDGVEYAVGGANLAAYRSLARSRGIELRQVLVAAVGDDLGAIIDLAPVETRAAGA